MHALGFRFHGSTLRQTLWVMRLCKPSLQGDSPFRLDLDADLVAGWTPGHTADKAVHEARTTPFADRVQLQKPADAWGLEGFLEVPQSFGVIYLGEAFCTYVSVGNSSSETVSNIVIKAELQTERQKVVLHDGSGSPLASLTPGARHDFIVSHDIKEVGPHTLICSIAYTAADGERKYLPQYFKFASHNPLSVRTKSRMVGTESGQPQVLLEACIENATKGTLFIEHTRFDPSPGLTATRIAPSPLEGATRSTKPGAAVAAYLANLQLLDPGGAMNVVYRVYPQHQQHQQHAGQTAGSVQPLQATPAGGSTALGRLEIKWRGMLGDIGRLQTQQVRAPVALVKDVELRVRSVSSRIEAEVPFQLRLDVRRSLDAAASTNTSGPFSIVSVPLGEAGAERQGNAGNVMVVGQSPEAVELTEDAEAVVDLTILPLQGGVQQLPTLCLQDMQHRTTFDSINLTVMVHAGS